MISGEKREEIKGKVGVFVGDIVAICPTLKQIKELTGLQDKEDEKEPEYIFEKDRDVPTGKFNDDNEMIKETKTVKGVRIDVYIREIKAGRPTDFIVKKAYFLEDRQFMSKTGTIQFVNSKGNTKWTDLKENLPKDFFGHINQKTGEMGLETPVREAKLGEVDLMEVLNAFLDINKSKPYNLLVDTKELFKGNFKELQDLLKTQLPRPIMAVGTVRTVVGDEGLKQYQDVWKKLMPAYNAKLVITGNFDRTKIDLLKEKQEDTKKRKSEGEEVEKGDWLQPFEKFVVEISDKENGCKDTYSLTPLHEITDKDIAPAQEEAIDRAGNTY